MFVVPPRGATVVDNPKRERAKSREDHQRPDPAGIVFFFPLSSTTTVRCTYYIQISIYAGSLPQAARSAVNSTTPCCFRLLRSPRCLSSLPRQQSRKRGFVGRDIPPGDRQRYYGGTMTGWTNGWGTLPRERLFALLSGLHASLPAARRRRLFQNPRASSFLSFSLSSDESRRAVPGSPRAPICLPAYLPAWWRACSGFPFVGETCVRP